MQNSDTECNTAVLMARRILHSAFCILNYVRKLKVGIDGRAFTSPAAGVRRYVSELVPALLASDEVAGTDRAGRLAGLDARQASITFLSPGIHQPTWDGPRSASRAPLDARRSI